MQYNKLPLHEYDKLPFQNKAFRQRMTKTPSKTATYHIAGPLWAIVFNLFVQKILPIVGHDRKN